MKIFNFSSMVRMLVAPLVLALTCSLASADFSGYYAPGNWTVDTLGANGSADFSGAPSTLVVIGPDGGSGFGYTDVFIAADATGTFSFDWSYSSVDDPGFDSGLYINNGFFFLSDTNGDFGSVSVAINAGDTIGFTVESADQLFGAGVLTITNFSVTPIPEPSALALVLVGGVASFVRRRR